MSGTRASDGERFEPAESLVITDLDTLRVLTDPLRLRIMEALARDAETPQTVKRIAGTLGEGATKLYYHVGLLEEHGLLRATASRVVSGIIEKRYQPAARSITVDRSVLGASGDPGITDALGAAMGAILDGVREDVASGVREGRIRTGPDVPTHRRTMLGKTIGRLSAAHAESITRRLQALHEELGAAEDDDADAAPYALAVAFYPSRPQASEDDPA